MFTNMNTSIMAKQFILDCTPKKDNVFNCSALSEDLSVLYLRVANLAIFILSAIGFILNSIASYNFAFSAEFSKMRFFKFLKIYTFNCTLVNLNDTLATMTSNTLPGIVYAQGKDLKSLNKTYIIYYTFIYKTIWSFLYTLSGLLDLIIVYERILVYKPRLKFLRKNSVSSISFGIFAYAVLINVPIFFSRDYEILK